MKNFISDLQIVNSIGRLIKICCDNTAIVFFSKNNKSGSQSKHIDIKYLKVRDHIKRNIVVIEYTSIGIVIADSMTKDLLVK